MPIINQIYALVFKFKRLELIKHDKKHKLLDETVAINRLLNNAERLIKANFNQSDDEQRAQYDNAGQISF